MNRISAKRQALYMQHLGYVPQRTLTRQEREKCGLMVKSPRTGSSQDYRASRKAANYAASLVKVRNSRGAKSPQLSKGNSYQGQAGNGSARFIDPRSYITASGRVRLKGEDYTNLRREIFSRAGGRCERVTARVIHISRLVTSPFGTKYVDFNMDIERIRCNALAPWDGSIFTRGHLAHVKHGYRKTDTPEETLWSCAACHFKEHGLQWSISKNRPFTEREFNSYYISDRCLCFADKPEHSAMCTGCRETLSGEQGKALLHVIENGSGDALLGAMGEFRQMVRQHCD